MNPAYRIIHFEPDPFTGARFPLGAVVADREGGVRVVVAAHLPGADCLGGRQVAVMAHMLQEQLASCDGTQDVSRVLGPMVAVDAWHRLPSEVRDASVWVRSLFDRAMAAPSESHHVVGARRSTHGFRFFRTWNVDRYVRKTFEPATDFGGWLSRHGGLAPVSHWVKGVSDVLLMEPVVPTRSQFHQDLKDVAQKIGAYRFAVERADSSHTARLIVYLTAGGPADRRAEARETLREFAHDVVDTNVDSERSELVGRIRRLGSEADSQGVLELEA